MSFRLEQPSVVGGACRALQCPCLSQVDIIDIAYGAHSAPRFFTRPIVSSHAPDPMILSRHGRSLLAPDACARWLLWQLQTIYHKCLRVILRCHKFLLKMAMTP
jgi:hypothetical protein